MWKGIQVEFNSPKLSTSLWTTAWTKRIPRWTISYASGSYGSIESVLAWIHLSTSPTVQLLPILQFPSQQKHLLQLLQWFLHLQESFACFHRLAWNSGSLLLLLLRNLIRPHNRRRQYLIASISISTVIILLLLPMHLQLQVTRIFCE